MMGREGYIFALSPNFKSYSQQIDIDNSSSSSKKCHSLSEVLVSISIYILAIYSD